MRLSFFEVESIVMTFKEVFGQGKIYLFGSRADDTQKGGDIDLFLDVPYSEDIYSKKTVFLIKLEEKIGEQKVDIVFQRDDTRLIEQEIHKHKVELNMDQIKLQKYFQECEKHLQRMKKAYDVTKEILPLSHHQYSNLTDEEVKNIDQFLFRFSKLQDTIGDKIFKLILQNYNPDFQKLSFLDFLHELEKREILTSAEDWILLRKVRNNIAHQYDDEPEAMSQAINDIFAQFDTLKHIFENLKNNYKVEMPHE
ncbi:nucleotidyltransferase domain-containing protein [Sulfurospirillum multivorans]|uniref:NTP transferase domain-containing protein n=2 Tax=Sulfurospirillum multivorans TaxID=66821 RepID=A0AA86AN62_SULMK|nr:nucleotidyltransferase domain-containing protein [Sulfurospirillum multivorans]AHJ13726.1 NTP transferase domain-containing protein [Sulfurospirillum multivorans DSM 12446]QEH07216.1 NTP transferase domain-containing protein [Sulfurospirillum multivorans]